MIRRSSLSLIALAALVALAGGSDGIDIPEPDRAEREAAEALAESERAEAARVEAERQAMAAASGNIEGCMRWIEAFNALECMPEAARISPEVNCPESLSKACDQRAFWNCMLDKTRCEDGRPTRPDPSECPPPC